MRFLLISFFSLWLCVADTHTLRPKQSTGKYHLIFSDEFNQPDGSQPDSTKWSRAERNVSMWSRWISNSKDVVYIKDGKLVCVAKPNKSVPNDTAKMLTGAIWTKGKFAFKYGKVEVRMKTNLHQGNFPAVWMRNQLNKNDLYGEIDIVEMFGDICEAKLSIHSQYMMDNVNHNLRNRSSKKIDVTQWHVYGIEWTPSCVTWTIDGDIITSYPKPLNIAILQKGGWTFDTDFYIIMNQSVGDGRTLFFKPDVNHTYMTYFDWIRVYQFVK